jgi:polysaccharide biosynthesis transport protein
MTRPGVVSQEPHEVGSTRLRQVRAFIEQVEPAQADMIQMLVGALRGRMLAGAVLGAIFGVIFAIAIFLSTVPIYQSQGLMRIVARESKILYADADDSRLRLFDAFVLAETTFLQSRPVLDRMLVKLHEAGIDNLPSNAGDLAKAVEVKSTKGLITVSAKSAKSKSAAALVNSLLDAYADLRLEQTEGQQHFRTRELAAREVTLLQQLQAVDAKILEVGEEYGQDAIAKAHVNKISQIDDLNGRIDELLTTINQLETVGVAASNDTGDAEIKRSMLLDNSMASMTYDRAKKAAEAMALSKRYRADNPKVLSAQAEIEVLDKAIADRSVQISTLGRTGALTQGGDEKKEQSVDDLRALADKLQARRKTLEAEAVDLIARIVNLGYLKEERAQTRERLDETRRVLEQVRVESRNSTPGITEVIARGSVPDKPFEDKRKAMAMVGMMGGAGFGFALIALWGMLRPTIRSESDLGALGKTVVAAGSVETPDASVHKLRNALHIAMSRQPSEHGRVIAVIGGGKQAGVTTLSRMLAKSFSSAGSRTALVDANLGKRTLSEQMGAASETGITDWMAGSKQDAIPLLQRDGVTLLAAGRNRDMMDHSLSPRDVGRIMDTLAASNDIIVTDCGAATQVLSSTLFAANCDLVVLVLRRGVPLGEARSAVAAILAASRRQVLVVLTGKPNGAVPGWAIKAVAACAKPFAGSKRKMRQEEVTGRILSELENKEEAPRPD